MRSQYCPHKELICAVRARAGDTAGLHPRGPRAPRGLRAAGPGLLQHGRLLGRQVRSQGDHLSSVLIRICTAPPSQNVVATSPVQVCIQSVGFSLPLTLVTPCTLVTVISMCGARAYDKVASSQPVRY